MKILCFSATLLAFSLFSPAFVSAQMMSHAAPVPMSPQQFAASTQGQSVQISVRVQSIKRTAIVAQLLQHESASLAKATDTIVTLYFPDGTPVMMGTAADIRAGTVLFVYGIRTSPGHVDIKRAVVDTGYVKVR